MKRRTVIIMGLAVVMIIMACFADRLCPYDPNAQNLSESLQSPSLRHLMGTDIYGRDMFSRVLVGGKVSIFSALLLVAVITVVGTAVGVICGYAGGVADAVLMRISDFFLAFPGLIFAMAVAALLQNGIPGAVISLALVSWPKYARLARSETLSVRENAYIDAAVLAGDNTLQLIGRHILPNIAGPIIVTAALDIGTMMMEIAGLSFLGLGAQPPTAEWGSMMSTGRSMLQTAPWIVLSPGVGIFISVAVFNLAGDALRDLLDPGTPSPTHAQGGLRSDETRR